MNAAGIRRSLSICCAAAALGGLGLALAVPRAATAQEKGKTVPAALPADLAWVPPDAVGFVSVRLDQLWQKAFTATLANLLKTSPELLHNFERTVGASPSEIERITCVLPRLDLGPERPLVYVAARKGIDAKTAHAILSNNGQRAEQQRNGRTLYFNGAGTAVCLLNARTYVVGSLGELQGLLDRGPAKESGPLGPALRVVAAGKHAAVLAGNPEPVLRKLARQGPPEVLAPFLPLVEARDVLVTGDVENGLRGTVHFSYRGEAKAKEGARALEALRIVAQKSIDRDIRQTEADPDCRKLVELLKELHRVLRDAQVRTSGAEVQLALDLTADLEAVAAAVVGPMQRHVRLAAARAERVNNLKRLALAMHNFHDVYGRFPTSAVFDDSGKPLLSWRVLVLPYIGEQALFREFRLDEPWDSAHNKKLLAKMPRVFAVPGDRPEATETHYVGFVGPGAFFEGKQGVRIADITDGTSNTIMLVESAAAVPWTKPEDLPYDPDKPLPRLGLPADEGANVALCDGSVRRVPAKIRPETLRLAITRNDGRPLPADW